MLVEQEASICQLNINICPAKIAQRKQAQKNNAKNNVKTTKSMTTDSANTPKKIVLPHKDLKIIVCQQT